MSGRLLVDELLEARAESSLLAQLEHETGVAPLPLERLIVERRIEAAQWDLELLAEEVGGVLRVDMGVWVLKVGA